MNDEELKLRKAIVRRDTFLEIADLIGNPDWCQEDHAVAGGMCLFMDKKASDPAFKEALRRMQQLRRMLADNLRQFADGMDAPAC